MKASHCDECTHSIFKVWPYRNALVPDLQCTKGHRPRFFQVKAAGNPDWGWKRVCSDFEGKPRK